MTTEKFEQKQAEMSNEELIRLANKEVIELAKTYGNSHKMSVPPSINDTDMLLSEVIRRFEKLTIKNN
jgi:hypothetical protein